MNAADRSLGSLVAHQFHQDNIVAVHWESGIDSAVVAAVHDLIRLRNIPREVVEMRDLCFSQLLRGTKFEVGRIRIVRMKPRAMYLKAI
jgi:hypothetical protein